MRTILLKLLNLLFPSEKPSESDRLNYYADQRCKTCSFRLRCMQEEAQPMIESTWTEADTEAIRLDQLFQLSARRIHEEKISNDTTQRLPVAEIRRRTQALDSQEYLRRIDEAQQAMRRHGSSPP